MLQHEGKRKEVHALLRVSSIFTVKYEKRGEMETHTITGMNQPPTTLPRRNIIDRLCAVQSSANEGPLLDPLK